MKSFSLARGALAALTLCGAFAQAAQVNQWTVDVNTIFIASSILPGSGISNPNPTTLNWGTPTSANSGMDILNSPSSETVFTNGAAVANVSVRHRNNPIGGTTLTHVDIQSTVTLTPLDPAGSALAPAQIVFGIDFAETPNDPGVGNNCANGAANGVGKNINGCADIFAVSSDALNFLFNYDGQDYFISFFEQTSGLNPLSSAACLAATGSSNPCLGFETIEGQSTTVNFATLITTERIDINVPEPGSMSLVAGALLTLGFIGRRRRNRQG